MEYLVSELPIFTRRELFEIWQEKSGKDNSAKSNHVQNTVLFRFTNGNYSEGDIRQAVSRFCSEVAKRWGQSKRTRSVFFKKNSEWLDQQFSFPTSAVSEAIPSTSGGGRSQISFEESSERSKRRKTKELREKYDSKELSYAVKMSLRSAGKLDAAQLLNEAVNTTPSRASKIRKAWVEHQKAIPVAYSSEEALSLFVETKLTKFQYNKIRIQAKEKKADIYPSYHKIRAAKEQCYPDQGSIIISDLVAEVKLQALLDHTTSRILLAQTNVFTNISLDKISDTIVLISKWGCDGSTGHSEYKQKLAAGIKDSDMFITSFVPLQLYSVTSTSEKLVLWQNPRPSSVRYCRPIRIQYKKETTELAKEETDYIEAQIKNLNFTKGTIANKNVCVSHEMLLTMIDGKICNSITSTASAQICYVCGASPKEMNRIDQVVKRNVDVTTYRFGLSTLHAWIRFFECIIHIAYRLDFKKWQARGENKEKLQQRKERIQKQFRTEMGLLVDHVKPGGSGTSNDGNTARRFFKNSEKSAIITGISRILIERCAVVLETLSSGFKINFEAFDKYALETANLFVHEYPWFYMPASVHKILIHGSQIIEAALLPIGQMSEEAQESRNKDLKLYRRSHTRKMSRQATNEDLLHCLLVSSDPLITSLRNSPRRKRQALSSESLRLLAAPEEKEYVEEESSATSKSATSEDDTDSD